MVVAHNVLSALRSARAAGEAFHEQDTYNDELANVIAAFSLLAIAEALVSLEDTLIRIGGRL